jgi:hypothetical protein
VGGRTRKLKFQLEKERQQDVPQAKSTFISGFFGRGDTIHLK